MTQTRIVIDDERYPDFECALYRDSDSGLRALMDIHEAGGHVDELWLDHDLGEDFSKRYGWDDIMPVVYWLEKEAYFGKPLDVDVIYVHTANVSAAPTMIAALKNYYAVVRIKMPVRKSNA